MSSALENQPKPIESDSELKIAADDLNAKYKLVHSYERTKMIINSVYFAITIVLGHRFAKGNLNLDDVVFHQVLVLFTVAISRATLSTREFRGEIDELQRSIGTYLLEHHYPVDPKLEEELNISAQEVIAAAVTRTSEEDSIRNKWSLRAIRTATIEAIQHCGSAIAALFS